MQILVACTEWNGKRVHFCAHDFMKVFFIMMQNRCSGCLDHLYLSVYYGEMHGIYYALLHVNPPVLLLTFN